jgi:hypothetical protein
MCEHFVTVGERDSKHRPRQNLRHCALQLDGLFLCHGGPYLAKTPRRLKTKMALAGARSPRRALIPRGPFLVELLQRAAQLLIHDLDASVLLQLREIGRHLFLQRRLF